MTVIVIHSLVYTEMGGGCQRIILKPSKIFGDLHVQWFIKD